MSEFSGRVRGVVNTPTVSAASGRWSVRAVSKYVAAGVWPSIAVPGGDFEPIATVRAPSTGAAVLQFTSIPQDYAHLRIHAVSKLTGSGTSVFVMRINSVASGYSWHRLVGTGSTRVSDSGTGAGEIPVAGTPGSGSANIVGVHVIDIFDYSNTGSNPNVLTVNGYDTNGGGEILLRSGAYYSAAAVTSLQFYRSSDSFAAPTRFTLYGWKAPVS